LSLEIDMTGKGHVMHESSVGYSKSLKLKKLLWIEDLYSTLLNIFAILTSSPMKPNLKRHVICSHNRSTRQAINKRTTHTDVRVKSEIGFLLKKTVVWLFLLRCQIKLWISSMNLRDYFIFNIWTVSWSIWLFAVILRTVRLQ
jgi:hypothetical protein